MRTIPPPAFEKTTRSAKIVRARITIIIERENVKKFRRCNGREHAGIHLLSLG